MASSSIASILLNGINLNLDSIEEEQHYILKMQEYFEKKTDFTAYLRGDRAIEVENKDMVLALELRISESTLYILPYSDDVFEIFTEVLKFISDHHIDVVSDFRGNEESKIENLNEVNKTINEEQEEEESSSDDDYEWI